MLAATGLVTLKTPLVGKIALIAGESASTHTLQTNTAVLTVGLAIMSELAAGLARTRMTKTGVDVPRRGSLQGVTCGGLDGLLAVAALDIGVICLAAGFIDGVGGVGVAGGSGARGICLGMEFGGVVAGGCLDAWFVLICLLV